MNNTSLLVPAVDNYLDNIDALLSGAVLVKDGADVVGQIIQEQIQKILENAELYRLENSAKNKDEVFLIEYTYYVYRLIIKKCEQPTSTYLIVSKKYENHEIKTNKESLEKMSKILNYLTVSVEGIRNIELAEVDNEIHIKINLEKIEEQGLQIK